MRSYLPFLLKRNTQFDQFLITTQNINTKYHGTSIGYNKIITIFQGVKDGKKIVLDYMDTGLDDLWGGVLGTILAQITNSLNDFKHYRWKGIKQPVVDYWRTKQRAAIAQQKRDKVRTIYTPAGDYTLWRIAEFITNILLVKYALTKNVSILSNLENNRLKGFEKDFVKLVLNPLKTYSEIEKIIISDKQAEQKAEEIIDLIILPKNYSAAPYERILDPEFKDETPFLSDEDEYELHALWQLYEEENQKVESDGKLSKIRKRIKMADFWNSIQGKRLNYLNSRRAYGGTLAFEEKENRKNKRSKEISADIEELLNSWGFDPKGVKAGLRHYQYLYQKETLKRWQSHKNLRDSLDKSNEEMDIVKNILQGNWDSNSLTLFTVIIGLAISVGLGIASVAERYKTELALGGTILSIIIFILMVKLRPIRRRILALMSKILS